MKIGNGVAFVIAVILHLCLVVILVLNVSLSKPEKPDDAVGELMHATFIPPAKGNPNAKGSKAPQAAQESSTQASNSNKETISLPDNSKAELQREMERKLKAQQELERQRSEAVAKKQQEEAARLEAERKALALKKAEEQKKLEEQRQAEAKAAADAKAKAEAEAKAKAAAEAKAKAEAEAKAKAAAEAKAKAEAEAKAKAAADAKAKADALAKAKAAAAAKAQADSLEDDILGTADGDPVNGQGLGSGNGGAAAYGAKVRALVEQNWRVDPSMNGKKVMVKIQVANDGTVSGESCQGDDKVCKSAIDAIRLVGMLPKPPADCQECSNIVISMTPKL